MKRRSISAPPVILLVEDEPLVREYEIDVLHESGFRVVEAATADEAFDLIRKRPDVQAVLTDVDMPGSINGFEFARLVRQGWPEIGILVTSGKMMPGPEDLPSKAVFLPKPYRPAELVAQLRQILRDRRQAQAEGDEQPLGEPIGLSSS